MYHMQLLPFILLSSFTSMIYMYLYALGKLDCILLHIMHDTMRWTDAGLYTHAYAYLSTTWNRLEYIRRDIGIQYIRS